MKICSKCKVEKPFTDFNKSKSNKDGHGIYCTPCRKEKKRQEYLKNRDRYLSYGKAYREENPEKVAKSKKKAYQKKPEYYKQMHKAYYDENRDAVLKNAEIYRLNNRELIRARDNNYKARNREILSRKQSEYQRKNSEKLNAYRRKYMKEKRTKDRLFSMRQNMRARFRFELAKRGDSQLIKANQYLGCSWIFLREYISKKFTTGMSWDNYGEWHIDHVMPLASARSKEELIKLCHYSNLQPLWAFDNLSKGAKMPEQLIA
ncbi:hypothetical protein ABH305_05215 [Acinetobacter pittii]|uniref:hypothetical protein n=1 Tax=Acinetobacter pittii TaxID=48296 RepID=UPI0032608AA6